MVFVWSSEIFLTIYGLYKYPPLTTDETAVTCWIGVTLTPWPKAVVANSTLPTLFMLNIIPAPSPFKSMPVLLPKPNLSKYENSVFLPSNWPIFTKPGLLGVYTGTL